MKYLVYVYFSCYCLPFSLIIYLSSSLSTSVRSFHYLPPSLIIYLSPSTAPPPVHPALLPSLLCLPELSKQHLNLTKPQVTAESLVVTSTGLKPASGFTQPALFNASVSSDDMAMDLTKSKSNSDARKSPIQAHPSAAAAHISKSQARLTGSYTSYMKDMSADFSSGKPVAPLYRSFSQDERCSSASSSHSTSVCRGTPPAIDLSSSLPSATDLSKTSMLSVQIPPLPILSKLTPGQISSLDLDREGLVGNPRVQWTNGRSSFLPTQTSTPSPAPSPTNSDESSEGRKSGTTTSLSRTHSR